MRARRSCVTFLHSLPYSVAYVSTIGSLFFFKRKSIARIVRDNFSLIFAKVIFSVSVYLTSIYRIWKIITYLVSTDR